MSTAAKSSFMSLPLWLYIANWLFFAYLFVQIIGFRSDNANDLFVGGMYFIEFGVHEASHLVVMFLPPLLVAAAGSIGELSFTLLLLAATIKAKAYFASVFAGLWVMLALRSVGIYMADARAQQLPLIGPGETAQHDWHFVFEQLGWLTADTMLGGMVQGLGVMVGVVALVCGLLLVVLKMIQVDATVATTSQ